MAKRSVSISTVAMTALADGVDLTNALYPACIQGGSSTQRIAIIEIYLGGQATASAPTYMMLSLDGQVGTGTNTLGTGQADAALDGATAALAAPVKTGNTWATAKPQRSSVGRLLNLSFNAFGGIVRWVATPGEEIYIVGNVTPVGEASLSAFTGGTPGALGAHLIYEAA